MTDEPQEDAMYVQVEGAQDEHEVEKTVARIPTALVEGKPGDSKATDRVYTVSAEDAFDMQPIGGRLDNLRRTSETKSITSSQSFYRYQRA
uniref:Efflux RND transporter periplasmic adaptor subunit n=1 Tax=Haemonchus contortus TaxID=6289 RepID=A0A7I4Y3Y4_HAECO